jgi:hypothetical protein
MTLPHFWIPVWQKRLRLVHAHCPYDPSAKEVGGLEVFLNEAAKNFALFSNIQDQN